MGTHPIFESDFDCLTECQVQLHKQLRGVPRRAPRPVPVVGPVLADRQFETENPPAPKRKRVVIQLRQWAVRIKCGSSTPKTAPVSRSDLFPCLSCRWCSLPQCSSCTSGASTRAHNWWVIRHQIRKNSCYIILASFSHSLVTSPFTHHEQTKILFVTYWYKTYLGNNFCTMKLSIHSLLKCNSFNILSLSGINWLLSWSLTEK